jgi:hypothetical protein
MEFVQDLLTAATQVIALAGFGGIAAHAIFKQYAKTAAIYAEVPHATPATKPQAEVEPVTEEPTEQLIIDEQPAIADPWEMPITTSSRRWASRKPAQPCLYLLPPAKEETKPVTPVHKPATKKSQQPLEANLDNLDAGTLRKLCTKYGIAWRNVRGTNRHATKAMMLHQLREKATA